MENENKLGYIIEMDGKTFIKEFIEEQDVSQFQYVVISTDITTSKELKNVYHTNCAIPTSATMQYHFDDDKKSFKIAYMNELCEPYNKTLISTIVYMAVERGLNIVLICSEEENEYKYLKAIRKFIEKIYSYPTFKYSKYRDYVKEHDKLNVEDIEKTKRIVLKEMNELEKQKQPIQERIEQLKKSVKDMGKKDLKEFLKLKKVPKKKYSKLGKKELRKFVCDYVEAEMEKQDDLYSL